MKLTSVIVEDEKLTADRLEKLVHEHSELEVIHKLFSVKSAIKWFAQNQKPDVIFLDIQLGDGTGFDVLESIDAFPHVIFTTAFDQHMLRAFKYNSIDYLLKPVKPESLTAALEKLNRINDQEDFSSVFSELNARLFKKYKKKFLIKTGLKYRSISVDEISYFYSKESCTYLRCGEGEDWIVDNTLDELESMLDPQLFFRINRHILIKEDKIATIDSYFNSRLILDIEPKFEEDVIVSREKVKQFKQWLDE